MKFNLNVIRRARDYAELLSNLNGFEKELREKLVQYKAINGKYRLAHPKISPDWIFFDEVILREILEG